MWYEIIPSFMLIAGALSIPGYVSYIANKAALGNAYRRNLSDRWYRLNYQRDYRLTGNPYISNGLESVPDK